LAAKARSLTRLVRSMRSCGTRHAWHAPGATNPVNQGAHACASPCLNARVSPQQRLQTYPPALSSCCQAFHACLRSAACFVCVGESWNQEAGTDSGFSLCPWLRRVRSISRRAVHGLRDAARGHRKLTDTVSTAGFYTRMPFYQDLPRVYLLGSWHPLGGESHSLNIRTWPGGWGNRSRHACKEAGRRNGIRPSTCHRRSSSSLGSRARARMCVCVCVFWNGA